MVSLPPDKPGGIPAIFAFSFSRLKVNLRRGEPGGILDSATSLLARRAGGPLAGSVMAIMQGRPRRAGDVAPGGRAEGESGGGYETF